MTKFIKISTILLLAFFISGNLNAQRTQKSKQTNNKTVTKKTNKRVSSKTVKYKKEKRKVVSVRKLPTKTLVKHKGNNYYYSNNKFYTYSRGTYINIIPKVGFRVKTLPKGYKIVNHLNKRYFWFNGIFYNQINYEYEVVEPEIGTITYELPNDYSRVSIDGFTYYEYSNVLYEKIQHNGTRAYEVVGFIEQ